MRKLFPLFFLLVCFSQISGQEKPKNREWFYIALGPTYSIEDKAYGANIRAAIPMQKGFYFVSQATYLPNKFGYKYEEFRYEFNVELSLFSAKGLSLYTTAGLNFGYWQRKFTTLYLNPPSGFYQDRSLLFGGGLNYRFTRIQIFSDFKWYPEISASHASLGIKINFFENKKVKNAYFDFLKTGGKKKSSTE